MGRTYVEQTADLLWEMLLSSSFKLHVRYDVDQDMHLRGRGLRLVPSYFCHGSPTAVVESPGDVRATS